MNRFVASFAVVLGLFVALSEGPLHAACKQSDATGNWTAYLIFGDAWQYCDLSLSGTKIKSGGACYSNGYGTGTITGGSFVLQSTCNATATIYYDSARYGSITIRVPRATMAKDKNVATGVCTNSAGQEFTMQLIKR